MKYFIMTCATFAICFPSWAFATPSVSPSTGTTISKEASQQYYENCMAQTQTDQTMKPETKNVMCQCTALHMQKSMTMEDIANLSRNDQVGRNALNKVLIEVQAPCMEYPVRDLIAKQCAMDVKNNKICNCLSDKMAAYTAREAQNMLGNILAKNPNITDPMGAIMSTPQFQNTQQQIAYSCAMDGMR